MNKLLSRLLLAALLAPLAQAALAASSGIDYSFKVPQDVNRNLSENPELYGFYSTTRTAAGAPIPNNDWPVGSGEQWFTGQGVLEDVYLSTGATSTYVVCADSASTTNTNVNDPMWVMVIPRFFANTTQGQRMFGTATSGAGRMAPMAIKNGLWCFVNVAIPYTPVFRQKGD